MIFDWSGRNRKCRAFALAHRRKRLPEGRTDGFTPRPVARFGGTGVKYRAGEGGKEGGGSAQIIVLTSLSANRHRRPHKSNLTLLRRGRKRVEVC